MVSLRIARPARHGVDGVRMDQGAERAAVDDQPGHEGAELRGREEADLEHGDGVRPDGLLPERVDAELGDLLLALGSVQDRWVDKVLLVLGIMEGKGRKGKKWGKGAVE